LDTSDLSSTVNTISYKSPVSPVGDCTLLLAIQKTSFQLFAEKAPSTEQI